MTPNDAAPYYWELFHTPTRKLLVSWVTEKTAKTSLQVDSDWGRHADLNNAYPASEWRASRGVICACSRAAVLSGELLADRCEDSVIQGKFQVSCSFFILFLNKFELWSDHRLNPKPMLSNTAFKCARGIVYSRTRASGHSHQNALTSAAVTPGALGDKAIHNVLEGSQRFRSHTDYSFGISWM